MIRPVLRTCLWLTVGSTWFASPSLADVVIDMTTIGNPGNAPDHPYPIQSYSVGDVDYIYQIGTYEVTVAQYTSFLNAAAKSDPYGLYNPLMGSGGGYGIPIITQTGTDGSYAYTAATGTENEPVRFVSLYNAARFCNWMANGQGSSSTETGSYSMALGDVVTRGSNATWVVPTESEWYKAAYYSASNILYHTYPNGSDASPVAPTNGTTAREMNFGDVPYWAPNGPLQLYTGTGQTTGHSPYGVYDMGGNVSEWTESFSEGSARITRGGSFISPAANLATTYQSPQDPSSYGDLLGFRVADIIPEPTTLFFLLVALPLVLAARLKSIQRPR